MIKALNLSFKNRIAFNYIISSAVFICIVFVFIFQVVKYSVNNHINEEIYDESYEPMEERIYESYANVPEYIPNH
jgi:hypothetical protein